MELISHYAAVRSRLWNPPNARADEGIDLKRRPYEVPVIRHRRSPPPLPVIVQHAAAPPVVAVEQIVAEVAAAFNVPEQAISGRRRHPEIMRPRQVAMALARRLTGKSLPEVGRLVGGFDHTTILHACRKPAIAALVEAAAAEVGDSRDPAAWAAALRRIADG